MTKILNQFLYLNLFKDSKNALKIIILEKLTAQKKEKLNVLGPIMMRLLPLHPVVSAT